MFVRIFIEKNTNSANYDIVLEIQYWICTCMCVTLSRKHFPFCRVKNWFLACETFDTEQSVIWSIYIYERKLISSCELHIIKTTSCPWGLELKLYVTVAASLSWLGVDWIDRCCKNSNLFFLFTSLIDWIPYSSNQVKFIHQN